MKIVLDTNVLVSGLLKTHSSAGMIIRMLGSGVLKVVYDSRILAEYKDVLYRSKFCFDRNEVESVLMQIKAEGIMTVPKPIKTNLPDQDDEPFLEAVISEEGAVLVTGNKKHFPLPDDSQILIFNPSEFIDYYRELSEND